MTLHRRLLLAGIAGPIVAWGLTVVVIVGWPGYDPIAQSISLLANAPLGWLQTVAFGVSGILEAAWAVGLVGVLGSTPRDRRIVLSLLLLQSAITVAFAIFPTDPGARALTTIGKIHLANFYLYAVTLPLTLGAIAVVMRRDPRWQGSVRPTQLAAVLLVVSTFLVPLTLEGPLTPWLGLLERIYVAIPSVWQVAVAVRSLRLLRTTS